jgi:hypothetical protein
VAAVALLGSWIFGSSLVTLTGTVVFNQHTSSIVPWRRNLRSDLSVVMRRILI